MNVTDIKSNSDNLIILQHYKSLKSDSHIKEKKMNFQELCRWLAVFSISDTNKYDSGLYLFAEMKKPYRNNENVINRTALVLDFDDLTPDINILSRFKEVLKFSYVVHSSYNHTPELPRLRLVIPLDEPIAPKYYIHAIQLIEESLKIKCDPHSYTVSQAQGKGVKKHKESPFIFEYQDTHFMKSKSLIKILDKKMSETDKKVISFKRSDEYWANIAMGVEEGERNGSLASLIGLLFRRYIPKELVYGLAYSWAKQCNPPIEDKEINKTYKSIYKKHYNIK